ncbi:extracellular solute-binding protein [Streptomyces aidingensis]|uniref:extracellular solute-binding protein n=1 Tax=Streptomyces aidingensis TaxID=910347 RepID=UPI001587145A|nr:extracellular solute-binding protein [Streptomyces aidingensis]
MARGTRRRPARASRAAALAGSLAAAAVLGTAAGCGPVSGDGSPVTLELIAADYGERTAVPIKEYWDDLTERFHQANPEVTVEVELVPWEELDATLAERVEQGRPPDISQATFYAGYATEGLLYQAKEILPLPVQSDFVTTLAHAGEVDFQQFGIPFITSTPRLFYNTALFDAAGIEEPPGSWAELAATAQALKDSGVTTPYALQFGPDSIHEEAMVWMLAAGGGYTNLSGGYILDDEDNVRALEWLRENMVAPGLTGPDGTLNRGDAYAGFMTGEVGMLMVHPALLPALEANKIPYAHTDFPAMKGGAAVPAGHSDWLLGFREHGHAEEIGRFLTFLYDPENVARANAQNGSVPATESAGQMLRASEEFERLWEFIDQMPGAQLQPVNKDNWLPLRGEIQQRLAAVLEPDTDVAEVMRGLQATAAELESGSASDTS